MDLTTENKALIDALPIGGLLAKVRFAPIGDPWFQGETGDYWLKRLSELRASNNVAYVRASKALGH